MHFARGHSAVLVFLLSANSLAWMPGEEPRVFASDGVEHHRGSIPGGSAQSERRYLPSTYGNDKKSIRGVNLGGLFIVENWMEDDVFAGFGCNSTSEFDCVLSLHDQDLANSHFQRHWNGWITRDDFSEMVSYGLNTVRIPVGYWFLERLVEETEYFPQGGEAFLDQVVGWAKDAGLYVILGLHGAPGAQVTNAFTGQLNADPAFYHESNFDRAYQWLEWMTKKVHTNLNYSTVGMLELVNEPERVWNTAQYPDAPENALRTRQIYYPTAWSRIRAIESSLNVTSDAGLSILMMGEGWGSGDPGQYLASDRHLPAYDEHRYASYGGLADDQSAYLRYACDMNLSSEAHPVIIGEWSLAVATDIQWTDGWNPNMDDNKDFYRKLWAAQVVSYESQAQGWVFWTWKTTGTLDDPRWDYQKGVAAGIIDSDIDNAYSLQACSKSDVTQGASSRTGAPSVLSLIAAIGLAFSLFVCVR